MTQASELVQSWIHSLEDKSPINLYLITQPFSDAMVGRIKTLETLYERFIVYRFLNRRLHPVFLLLTVTGGLSYMGTRFYRQSTQLVLTLVGATYPLYCSWKLIRQEEKDKDRVNRWMTYWMAFASFQVIDRWIESDMFFSRKKYNLYKLFILYWLQSPHSNGASLLYKHVLWKPTKKIHSDSTIPNGPVREQETDHLSIQENTAEKEPYTLLLNQNEAAW